MKPLIIEQEVLNLLLTWVSANSNGQRIIPIKTEILDGILVLEAGTGGLNWWENEVITPFSKLNEEAQLHIYMFLDVNKAIVKTQNSVVELPDWEKLNWKIAPKELVGKDNISIGRVAVAYHDKRETNSLLAVLFISADNTWSTLTMYEEDNLAGKMIANDDLLKIGEALKALSVELFSGLTKQ